MTPGDNVPCRAVPVDSARPAKVVKPHNGLQYVPRIQQAAMSTNAPRGSQGVPELVN